MKGRYPFESAQQGVAMIEVLIAILIFSIGVLGIVGMQANMIKNTSDSKYRSDAAFIAQQKIGQMWADPGNLPADLGVTVDISDVLPAGTRTVTQPAPGQFDVTVTWQQPGEAKHQFTTTARVAGG